MDPNEQNTSPAPCRAALRRLATTKRKRPRFAEEERDGGAHKKTKTKKTTEGPPRAHERAHKNPQQSTTSPPLDGFVRNNAVVLALVCAYGTQADCLALQRTCRYFHQAVPMLPLVWRMQPFYGGQWPGRFPPGATALHLSPTTSSVTDPVPASLLPPNLTRLTLGDHFEWPLASPGPQTPTAGKGMVLPPRLRFLDVGELFNQPLGAGVLPETLQELHIGTRFDQTDLHLPAGLQSLAFAKTTALFNRPFVAPPHISACATPGTATKASGVVVLPRGLRFLRLGRAYNHPLGPGVLPTSLQGLWIGEEFDSLLRLPRDLKALTLSEKSAFSHRLCAVDRVAVGPTEWQLPVGLKMAVLGGATRRVATAAVLPRGLTVLYLGPGFAVAALTPGALPPRLTALQCHTYPWPLRAGVLPPSLRSYAVPSNHGPIEPHAIPNGLRRQNPPAVT